MIAGVERNLDLFIGGCNPATTEDNIKAHISSKGIQVVGCVVLQSKVDWYKPFKVTVKAAEREILLSPDLWPQGVFVRKFFNPRSPQSGGFQN